MTAALVPGQTASAFNGAGASVNVVLTNNPTRGSLVVVGVVHGGVTITATVADSAGNVYKPTPLSPVTLDPFARMYNFYLQDAPPNASKTITVTLSASTDTTVNAAEFSGAERFSSVVDTEGAHNNAASQTNINDPTLSPNADGEILFNTCAGSITSADSPWTGVGTIANGNYAEYLIQGKRATQAVAYTQSPAGVWGIVATCFMAANPIIMKPIVQPADDESGWISETTQIKEWWGSDASLRGWLDADFIVPTVTTQNITGVKYNNTQTFGVATVGRGAVNITGVKFTNLQSFGVAKLSLNIVGTKFTNNQTFGVATIGRGVRNVTGVKYTNNNTFGAAIVGRGSVNIAAVRFNNATTFGAASISSIARILGVKFNNPNASGTAILRSTYSISGVKFTNLQSFKVAVVSSGASAIIGTKFTNSQAFGVATIGRGVANISGVKFTNAQTFATAVVASLLQTIDGHKFTNNSQFFASAVANVSGGGGGVPIINDWQRHTRRNRR